MTIEISGEKRGHIDGRSCKFKEIEFTYSADGDGNAGEISLDEKSAGYIEAITLAPAVAEDVGTIVVEDSFSIDLVSGNCTGFNGRVNFANGVPFNGAIKIQLSNLTPSSTGKGAIYVRS